MFLWGPEDMTGAPQAQRALRRGERSGTLLGWGCPNGVPKPGGVTLLGGLGSPLMGGQ